MATLKEMSNVIDSIRADSPLAWGEQPHTLAESRHRLRCALINAEAEGRYYIGENYWVHNEPCNYWVVGDYVVTYLTDNLDFHAGRSMLSDDMMDDLIIEGRFDD